MNRLNRRVLPQTTDVVRAPLKLKQGSPSAYPLSACLCVVLPRDLQYSYAIIQRLKDVQALFDKSYIVFVAANPTESISTAFSNVEYSTCFCLQAVPENVVRNTYLSFVLTHKRSFHLMMVLDTSALLKDISPTSLICLSADRYNTWDAVFANQSYKYYDVTSLRSEQCKTAVSDLPESERIPTIRRLQYHIPRDSALIPVISAFGGLAIYKVNYLVEGMYRNDGHVSFNILYGLQNTRRLFIDPSLVLDTPEEHAPLYT